MFHIIMLLMALSVDVFVAGLAYSTNRIKIKFICAAIINGISSACLGFALCIGTLIDELIPETLTYAICFCSLFLIGLIKILDFAIKKYMNKGNKIRKHYIFSLLHLDFVIYVSGNPVAADKDASKQLSISESIILAFAMSLDGLVAGIGAAFMKLNIGITVTGAFIFGMIAIYAGYLIGRIIRQKLDVDLSWVSGILFLFLAFTKLYK